MSREERESASNRAAFRKDAEALASSDTELHRPPSVLWFVIPLVGIILYALLSR
jgi:hypothetical protein